MVSMRLANQSMPGKMRSAFGPWWSWWEHSILTISSVTCSWIPTSYQLHYTIDATNANNSFSC